jgi:EAL domain-containing protein (putative c-di-GMP-specific phosphodiesterase class I)
MIQDFGCTKIQGYYFSRPLVVEDARALAARRHREAA